MRCRLLSLTASVWETLTMSVAKVLDPVEIGRACRQHGVARLRVFGSSVTDRFDPLHSDIDFFVDFLPEVRDLMGNYLALKADLEQITGRKVDLVMSDAVENPYFAAEALRTVQDIYAA